MPRFSCYLPFEGSHAAVTTTTIALCCQERANFFMDDPISISVAIYVLAIENVAKFVTGKTINTYLFMPDPISFYRAKLCFMDQDLLDVT
jgi:hypothetical protein